MDANRVEWVGIVSQEDRFELFSRVRLPASLFGIVEGGRSGNRVPGDENTVWVVLAYDLCELRICRKHHL